jgi:hypothetical protein
LSRAIRPATFPFLLSAFNSIYLKLNDISLCKPFLNQLNQSNHYNTNNSKIISKKKEVLQKPQKHTKLFALYPKKKDLSIKFPHQKNNFSITERITNSITESNNNNINISSRNAPRKVNKTSLTKLSLLTLNENQTILDLLNEGYNVYFAHDCSSSRSEENHKTALELTKQFGAKITSLEIILFEFLKSSRHPNFKEIQALIK